MTDLIYTHSVYTSSSITLIVVNCTFYHLTKGLHTYMCLLTVQIPPTSWWWLIMFTFSKVTYVSILAPHIFTWVFLTSSFNTYPSRACCVITRQTLPIFTNCTFTFYIVTRIYNTFSFHTKSYWAKFSETWVRRTYSLSAFAVTASNTET